MKPAILQERMAKITDIHRTPCPTCSTDTIHLGLQCLACGHQLLPSQVPPPDRYQYPEPPKPASPDGWRLYFGEPE